MQVSGAFHTPLMQPAGNAFNAQLRAAAGAFKPTAGTKLYSNVTGEPAYTSGGAASVEVLGKHMTSSVQWIKQVPPCIPLHTLAHPCTPLHNLAPLAHP